MSGHMKAHHTEVIVGSQVFIVPLDKEPLITIFNALGAIQKKSAPSKEGNILADDLMAKIFKDRPKGSIYLRGARTRENMSQQELMKATGIPVYNISKMENGSRPIGEEIAKRLAKALNADYKMFMKK